MAEMRLTMLDPAGLHARPAAHFVQVASRFRSQVAILHDGREANAKSLISILGLGIRPGTEITLRADGPDSAEALATLFQELAIYVSPTQDP
jgi:phosphocarrier protein